MASESVATGQANGLRPFSGVVYPTREPTHVWRSESGSVAERFADMLRSQRLRAGLTQQALADLSTVSPRAIRDLESGRARGRVRTLQLLADGLGLRGLARESFLHSGTSERRRSEVLDMSEAAPPGSTYLLVGRGTEVRAAVDALASGRRRVLSISGLVGVGKTRVAIEIVNRLHIHRKWPVIWIGGSSRTVRQARDGAYAALTRVVRSAIDLGATADLGPIRQLIGRHDAVIVLDGIADDRDLEPVEELLQICPGLRVISTSRRPWQPVGVRPTVLPPLPIPESESHGEEPISSLAEVPSVSLLVERLAEARPGFVLDHSNVGLIVSICRTLDGLPLALELIAERFRVLSLQQLAEMQPGDLLALTAPPRRYGDSATLGDLVRQSLAQLATRHHAWLDLLAPRLRWTITEAAESLGRPQSDVVEAVSALVDSGLVRAIHDSQVTRFEMLSIVRHQVYSGGIEPRLPDYV